MILIELQKLNFSYCIRIRKFYYYWTKN